MFNGCAELTTAGTHKNVVVLTEFKCSGVVRVHLDVGGGGAEFFQDVGFSGAGERVPLAAGAATREQG